MRPKISLLIPSYNSEKVLKKVFIPSLSNCSIDVEVICYDNGGNNLEENALDKEFSFRSKNGSNIDWIPIGDGKNAGMNIATNACGKIAKGDYFYWPHTDMYLMPNWDVELLRACKNLPPTSFLLCSRSIEPVKGHTEFHIIKNYGQEYDEFQEEKLISDFIDYNDKSIVSGYRMPFFFHRKLWDKMNGLDPKYICYASDDDLVQTAYHVGVRRFWMPYGSLVYHLQGKSSRTAPDKDDYSYYDYFIDKWRNKGYKAKHPAYLQPELMPMYIKVK